MAVTFAQPARPETGSAASVVVGDNRLQRARVETSEAMSAATPKGAKARHSKPRIVKRTGYIVAGPWIIDDNTQRAMPPPISDTEVL
jgi:hypothetical protein